jgi:hypothetical protein
MQVHIRQERMYTRGHTGKPRMIIGRPIATEIDEKRLRKLLAAGKLQREIAGEHGIPRRRRDFLPAVRRADGEARGA